MKYSVRDAPCCGQLSVTSTPASSTVCCSMPGGGDQPELPVATLRMMRPQTGATSCPPVAPRRIRWRRSIPIQIVPTSSGV
jgi:hypothetical protein